ncbi:putative duf636 domain-containing protein [Rosellinia necatrix]|uniref:Putative duf636 domain-containing protein n=1 Tax=Rosellinia necatrix TaxID=77044 RepID=A0A1S8A939_ROSNE|nr:putative duf636 domain-containing protein [Rosellinia necatrix]
MAAARNEDDDGGGGTLELVAHCLCGAQRFAAEVPLSALPLDVMYCHCTSCRRATGALYSTYVPWPGDPAAIRGSASLSSSSSLRRYAFTDAITTLFCGVCSSAMFAETRPAGGAPNYGVQTGVLANVEVPGGGGGGGGGSLLKITHHIFLGDTLDGGASPWLCDANRDGSRPRLWRGHRGQGEELSSTAHDWPAAASPAAADGDTPIRCHCGGVDLVLSPAARDLAGRPRSGLPWFVDPASGRSLGGFDACDSCRLSSGSDVFHWTFALLRHLAFPPTSAGARAGFPASSIELRDAVTAAAAAAAAARPPPADRDPRWGTLALYESSPGVQRYFCSRCSACVFYASDDRPEMVDVAVGLLDSGDGARAESLLSWDFGGEMVWRRDVMGGWREGFIQSVEAAAERWRLERGYPKNWRRIQKEEAKISN